MHKRDSQKWADEALNNPLLKEIYEQKTQQLLEEMLDDTKTPEEALRAREKAILWREWWRELQFALN